MATETILVREKASSKKNEKYVGVLEDFRIVEEKTMEELLLYSGIKWIFYHYQIDDFETSYGNPYYKLEFKCIDQFGKKVKFQYKNVQGLSFKEKLTSTSGVPGYGKVVQCNIYDYEGKLGEIQIFGPGFKLFFKKLIKELDDLADCLTWRNYFVLQKNQELEKEVDMLKRRIKFLENNIEELKK